MIPGPSLIVAPQTTTFVSPRLEASIHTTGNIVMTRREDSESDGVRVERHGNPPTPTPAGPAAPGGAGSARDAPNVRCANDYEVMWTRLQAVVEEQAQVLIRTAFSPIVRECGVGLVVSQFGDQYFEHRCIVAGAASRVAPEPERRVSVDTVADWSTAFA